MILNKSVEVKISRKNIDHFKQYYKYIKLKDIIQVDPDYLQKSSNTRLDVKCDICNIERNIRYQSYIKNKNSCLEYPFYTCDKCSHVKIKKTNMEKWGVEYFSQTEEYNVKFKKTMIEKWGVEHALQSKSLKDKAKKTNLEKFGFENPFMDSERIQNKFKEKWGVKHPSQVEEISKRIKKTNLNNHGYESHLSSPKIRKKIKETNQDKYGGHPMSNSIIFDKLKKTNLDKFGYEFTLSCPEIRKKIKSTNLERYGFESPMMSEISRGNFQISTHPSYIKYLGSNYSLFKCDLNHEFSISIDNYHSRAKNNTPLCTVCNPIGDSVSIKELDLYKFINSVYTGPIFQSYRNGLEIDIFLPELNIGFEFNGLYWHSEEKKSKKYHLDKTNHFKERGIRIIHIWEDDWDNKKEIIKSQIRNWIGSSTRKIPARKCKIGLIKEPKVIREFLDLNHIQGYLRSDINIGLFHQDKLVSIMTFDRNEGRKKMGPGEWNLSRFCSKIDTIVLGSASKLFSYFLANYSPKRVISYSDKNWSKGDIYTKLGFILVSETRPDYKYIIDNIRVHKSRFRKSRTSTDLTESQWARNSKILRVWDCGKMKFEINI